MSSVLLVLCGLEDRVGLVGKGLECDRRLAVRLQGLGRTGKRWHSLAGQDWWGAVEGLGQRWRLGLRAVCCG